MPIPLLADLATRGVSSIPFASTIFKTLPWIALLWLLKLYFAGAVNKSERLMRSKVVMITGGTSGIGAAVVRDLADRGAQIILLTHHDLTDPFLNDYLEDLRSTTNNELIYAEKVNLSSLHSIRSFATKWVDNSPPRRLDMIILCADTLIPKFGLAIKAENGVDPTWAINYLANFHLLSILSPALRAQPPDRDVRIVFATCSTYVGGDMKNLKDSRDPLPKGRKYETSKLATMTFAQAFQKHLEEYKRPDKQPNNARVILVDPGFTRTPGMRRWLTMGSLWGLLAYLATFPFWWLTLKSPIQGAQGFLRASMEAELGRGQGGKLIKECREAVCQRPEVKDEAVRQKLWEFSEKQIQALEKEDAVRRSLAKKEKEEAEKKQGNLESNNNENIIPTAAKAEKVPGSRRSRKAG